jgi:ribosomal protein L14
MEMMKEGDVVNAEFVFVATSRRFSRKDGSDGIIRGNDIVVKSIEKEVEAY